MKNRGRGGGGVVEGGVIKYDYWYKVPSDTKISYI